MLVLVHQEAVVEVVDPLDVYDNTYRKIIQSLLLVDRVEVEDLWNSWWSKCRTAGGFSPDGRN
jgi:hypothetical protein